MAITDKLTAIANAIRSKTGESGTMKLSDMPSKIAEIQTGAETVNAVYCQMNDAVTKFMSMINYTGNNTATITLSLTTPPASWSSSNPTYIQVSGNGNVATVTGIVVNESAGVNIIARDSGGNELIKILATYRAVGGIGRISLMGTYFYGVPPINPELQRPLGYSTNASGDIAVVDKYSHKENHSSNGTIYNITPSIDGGNFIAQTNGDVTAVGHLIPAGQVRMIYVPSVINVRDLGGWACDGGTVKYGYFFRGGEVLGNITDADKTMMKNLLGIRKEIDFTYSANPHSAFGEDVEYIYKDVSSYYDAGINLDSSNLATRTKYVDAIKACFDSAKYRKPTYFHCAVGADRTGTLAFILEQLAGVSENDSDKDYELTSFSPQAGIRTRNTAYSGSYYSNMKDYFMSCTTSNLMRDGVIAWCVLAGISIDDINEYRKNVSTGIPETVSTQIDYSVKNISVSPESVTIGVDETVNVSAAIIPSWASGTISWSTSDANKATVVGSGNSAVVTGVANGNVTITATCGNITRTVAVTVEGAAPSYTNVYAPSSDQLNKRLGSSGAESAQNGSFVTNYIDISQYIEQIKAGDFYIYVRGVPTVDVSGSKSAYFMTYNSEKTKISYAAGANMASAMTVLGDDYIRINLHSFTSSIYTGATYFRTNLYPNNSTATLTYADISDVVITLNEPIE